MIIILQLWNIEKKKLLDNTKNQPTKCRAKNSVEMNDYSRGILIYSWTVAALAGGGGNNHIQVVFKNCAPFTNCINKINNAQIDNAKDIDVVMLMYNLLEYSDDYLETSGSL